MRGGDRSTGSRAPGHLAARLSRFRPTLAAPSPSASRSRVPGRRPRSARLRALRHGELGVQGEDPVAVLAPVLLDLAYVQVARGGVDLGKERTEGTVGELGLDRGV